MTALNLDIDYFAHPKTKRLVRLLGKGSEVLPLKLWCYTAKYFKEDGRLTGISTQEIESEVSWWGEPGQMVEVMLKEVFLERDADGTLMVHDWAEHEGHISAFSERAKAAAKARWDKARGGKDPPEGDAPSNATSTASSNAPALPSKPSFPSPPTVAFAGGGEEKILKPEKKSRADAAFAPLDAKKGKGNGTGRG